MLKDLRIYNIRTMSDNKITNYNRSKIYMIFCEDEGVDEFYIGSSANLKDRIKKHKFACDDINCNNYNLKLYVYIRENFGFYNFTVKTLERYPCKNNLQLRQREQKWIDELKPTLNSLRAYLSPELRIIEKSKIDKVYKLKNKSILNEKANEVINCDHCDKTYTKRNKATHQKTKYCINYNSN